MNGITFGAHAGKEIEINPVRARKLILFARFQSKIIALLPAFLASAEKWIEIVMCQNEALANG